MVPPLAFENLEGYQVKHEHEFVKHEHAFVKHEHEFVKHEHEFVKHEHELKDLLLNLTGSPHK